MFSKEMQEAKETAGAREKYALEHGNKSIIYVHGEKCWKFTYSAYAEYQDANGAIYNTVQKRWVS